MNERIKQLAEQAKFMAEETINKQISKNAELDAFAEKFAELIVRECVDICEKDKKGFPNSDSVKQGLADMIKKHFGVEE